MDFSLKFHPPLLPQFPRKELEIESFSIGTSGVAGGGGSGSEANISLSRKWAADGASEALAIACANGKLFEEGLLTVYTGGGANVAYALRFKQVAIASFSQGSTSGPGPLSETFSLEARTMSTIYPK